MKKLIILRGPSGSGKTTIAKTIVDTSQGRSVRHEADDFFHKDGPYNFDASKLGQAHGHCQSGVRASMASGTDTVIVSNTSMARWELNPYLALAKEFGYDVKIYRVKGPWDAKLFASRNLHGVSEANIQKQINKYQPLESEEEYVE